MSLSYRQNLEIARKVQEAVAKAKAEALAAHAKDPSARLKPAPFFAPSDAAPEVARTLRELTGVRRRLYTAQNAGIYNAALSGYVGGVNQARAVTSVVSADYAELVVEGVPFAQAVDSLIAFDAALSTAKTDLLGYIVANVMGLKYPTGLGEEGFSATAGVVAAIYNAVALYLIPVAPPGAGPWQQVGEIISAIDEGASVEAAGGDASGTTSFAVSGGTASGPDSFAAGVNSFAEGDGAFACAGGVALGDSSFGHAQSTAYTDSDFAAAGGSIARGGSSAAFCGGFASGFNSFATHGGAEADYAASLGGSALGLGDMSASQGLAHSTLNGSIGYATAVSAGEALNDYAFAASQGTASGNGSTAVSGAQSLGAGDFAASGGSANSSSDTAGGGNASALSGGQSLADFSCAIGTSSTNVPSVASGIGSFACGGGVTNGDDSVSIGQCSGSVGNIPNCYQFGISGGTLLSFNADGLGTVELDLGANSSFVIGNADISQTGAAGGALSALPPNPAILWTKTINGTQYVFPGWNLPGP